MIYIYNAGPLFTEADIKQRLYEGKCMRELLDRNEVEYVFINPYELPFDNTKILTSKEIFSDLLFEKMKPLIRHASIITIAKEPKYFEYERNSDKFQNEEVLGLLLDVIAKAISE